jgi:hypothetical protein
VVSMSMALGNLGPASIPQCCSCGPHVPGGRSASLINASPRCTSAWKSAAEMRGKGAGVGSTCIAVEPLLGSSCLVTPPLAGSSLSLVLAGGPEATEGRAGGGGGGGGDGVPTGINPRCCGSRPSTPMNTLFPFSRKRWSGSNCSFWSPAGASTKATMKSERPTALTSLLANTPVPRNSATTKVLAFS